MCKGELYYYDGCLGYEAMKCRACDYELDLNAAANAKATAEREAEAEEKRRGALIREVLGLRRMREHPDRVLTSWGSKTDLGLFRTMARIIVEGR